MSTNEILLINHLDSKEVQMYMETKKESPEKTNISLTINLSGLADMVFIVIVVFFAYKILSNMVIEFKKE